MRRKMPGAPRIVLPFEKLPKFNDQTSHKIFVLNCSLMVQLYLKIIMKVYFFST